MDTQDILKMARGHLNSLKDKVFDELVISQPQSPENLCDLTKIISKISPLMGNLIEFKVTKFLNTLLPRNAAGVWKRQDPGFPDVIFDGPISPAPGFEIKAWFPFATEITGRFRDSEDRFTQDEIDLVILAWLPEHIFWGKPKIIDVCIVSAKSVAEARDTHYHKPPHYLVIEPENTVNRTANLQQSNTSGYVIQDTSSVGVQLANDIVSSWGKDGVRYSTSADYQDKLKALKGRVGYRLDTNYAKIDRIEHEGIEIFKSKVLNREINGKSIKCWGSIINDLPIDLARRILSNG